VESVGIPTPRDIAAKPKAYAFERSLGIPPAEACRRAGGKVENGQATKWERSRSVQAWLAHYRSLGHTEEMLAAKRARIEERLGLAAFGNIFDFTSMLDRRIFVHVDDGTEDGTTEERIVKTPVIDWDAVAKSPLAPIIESFKFDKDTGLLTDFNRDNALQALAQLRDMHGFKAVNKTALTDPTGEKPASLYLISERPMSEEEWEAKRAGA
jgi:hypothetical protein